ncbi:hypothetical protein BJX76DRAFT_351026 [Aspergillus varians]
MSLDTPTSNSVEDSRLLKFIYFSNEFPHDDLQDLLRQIHQHSKDRQHPALARLLTEATLAVRDEIRLLLPSLRALIPSFESVLDWADNATLRKGPLGGSVDGVLLCVVQLAAFIGYFEDHQAEFDFHQVQTCLAGLGIGLLATTAVSLSTAVSDISTTGAEAVRAAFRLGVHVGEVSAHLEPHSSEEGSTDSWACVIPDVQPEEVQKELDAIHEKENTPAVSRIFISALSPTSVTISGPPSRLKALFRSHDFFHDRKYVYLPVYGGLCHAPHIYRPHHVHAIVQGPSINRLSERYRPTIPVLSPGTGQPYSATTVTELFNEVIAEILTRRIEWSQVVQGVVERLDGYAASELEIHMFRKSLPVHELLVAAEDVATSTKDLIPWALETSAEDKGPSGPMQSKIAVVGMACRLPGGATDPEKFWSILEQGLDVHRKIPPDRFDVETHVDPTGKRINTSQTAYGCFIDEPGLFDAPFFNMSPREAEQTDPMQRLALVTAYEALEQGGYVPGRTTSTDPHRTGTFYGQAADDYREVNGGQEVGTYYIPGGCRAFGPGRINYFFGFWGPSFNIDTACSSSLAAIQAACTSLWAGDSDAVVAGGLNVLTNSDGFAGLSNGHFLSKTPNACKTWDAQADGYCRADGIVSVVLKRLEDAEADNDNILGVILSAATNHSADAVSITHPHVGAQAALTAQVLRRAAVDRLDVSYVEMHGTGTQAGDLVEIQSVMDVLAPSVRRRTAKQPLHIGAVKSNVGHSESAAGATALLKVLLMFQKEAIPRHVGIKTEINPGFPKDLERRNVHIPFEQQPWLRSPQRKRIAVINNFSAAGGNTTLVIEEPPVREQVATLDPRGTHAVAISAKSKVSLRGNIEQFLAYLDVHPGLSVADLSYSTTARRPHYNHRVAFAASDLAQVRKQLQATLAVVDSHKPMAATGPPSVAFAFTGQGAAYKSSNIELLHHAPTFRSQIFHLDSLAQAQGFPSFLPAIDGSFPREHEHSPVITQLALLCTEMALAKYWISLGVVPSVVVGHSLGEYAALYTADVISASDAIFLVGQRARMLEQTCQSGSHKMVAVRASLEEIAGAAGAKPYEIACINSPKEIVLSGTWQDMNALQEALETAGYRCYSLEVAFAFHSAQTDPILDEFEAMSQSGVVFHEPNLPVISPLLSKVVFGKAVNANYLRRATRETVNFIGALEAAQSLRTVDEKTVWIEIGPHPVCMGFVKAGIPAAVAVPSLRRGEDSWTTISQGLCTLHSVGLDVNWNEFHRPFESSLHLLPLPTYQWNDKTYWLQYNGDWALTKGNTFYDAEKRSAGLSPLPLSSLKTSTVHQIVEESIVGSTGRVVMQSDLMHPDFFAAANGHRMNNCAVVTSSIHADIAYTLGEYLYRKFKPSAKSVHMDVTNLEVLKGLVAQKKKDTAQLIQVSIETSDLQVASMKWARVQPNGAVEDPFASANVYYGDVTQWLNSWASIAHLVQGRIEALTQMADKGVANRFSNSMAYRLFAQNLVDYAGKYRGMQSVVMHGLEGYADIELTGESGGTWTIPPQYIDSVAHLAGFLMNVSDAIDTKNNFCVTPGWKSMRFARPLVAGARYQSYTKMIPTPENPTVYMGDVYILQDNIIVGMVGGIEFHSYPRILLSRFFSAPDDQSAPPVASAVSTSAVSSRPPAPEKVVAEPAVTAAVPEKVVSASNQKPAVAEDSTAAKALALIAGEAALDISDLHEEASFANLGIDSLMSLVIAEKFREQLGITIGGGLFLEYPTIGDLTAWLNEYYS